MKHTKGNWIIFTGKRARVIIGEGNQIVAQINDNINGDQFDANAKLIAAAPAMLYVLNMLDKHHDRGIYTRQGQLKIRAYIKDAIKKATD